MSSFQQPLIVGLAPPSSCSLSSPSGAQHTALPLLFASTVNGDEREKVDLFQII